MAEAYYADFDGLPSRTNGREAWVYNGGVWREINSASHGMNAQPLSKEAFDQCFPGTPPLPPQAFKDS
jgi:hypothetical protein